MCKYHFNQNFKKRLNIKICFLDINNDVITDLEGEEGSRYDNVWYHKGKGNPKLP